jgi:hypothetical protein
MTPRRKRRDGNHAEIVDALRAIGCSVVDIADVGGGIGDVLVGYHGRNYLLEIKDGSRPPSERQLTEAEADMARTWRGHWTIVETVDEAIGAVGNGIARRDPVPVRKLNRKTSEDRST